MGKQNKRALAPGLGRGAISHFLLEGAAPSPERREKDERASRPDPLPFGRIARGASVLQSCALRNVTCGLPGRQVYRGVHPASVSCYERSDVRGLPARVFWNSRHRPRQRVRDGRLCSHRSHDRRRNHRRLYLDGPIVSRLGQLVCKVVGKLVDARSVEETRDGNRHAKLLLQPIRERNRPQRVQADFVQRLIRIDRVREAKLRHDAPLQNISKPGGIMIAPRQQASLRQLR